ncbi:MAG: hypothetical protein K2L10_04230 [Ruminococcus sp.]|nr:hypothetical protein [Ruminococcus sp.]
MKTLSEIKKTAGVVVLEEKANRLCGWLYARHRKRMFFIAVWNDDWEKVSVSRLRKCPEFDELCETKDIFWTSEEFVVQYIPSEPTLRNCIHLFRPVGAEMPVPTEMLSERGENSENQTQ